MVNEKRIEVLLATAIGTNSLSFNALEMLGTDPVFAHEKKKSADQVWPDLVVLKQEISRRAYIIKYESEWSVANGGNPHVKYNAAKTVLVPQPGIRRKPNHISSKILSSYRKKTFNFLSWRSKITRRSTPKQKVMPQTNQTPKKSVTLSLMLGTGIA